MSVQSCCCCCCCRDGGGGSAAAAESICPPARLLLLPSFSPPPTVLNEVSQQLALKVDPTCNRFMRRADNLRARRMITDGAECSVQLRAMASAVRSLLQPRIHLEAGPSGGGNRKQPGPQSCRFCSALLPDSCNILSSCVSWISNETRRRPCPTGGNDVARRRRLVAPPGAGHVHRRTDIGG